MIFIDENLQKLINTNNVLMILPYREKNKRVLCALIKDDGGNCKFIPLTKPQSFLTFHFEPIYELRQMVGQPYMKKFAVIDNVWAFNKDYLAGFGYANDPQKINQFLVFAKFNDGSDAVFMQDSIKNFNKTTIYKLNNFLKENGKIADNISLEEFTDRLIDKHLSGFCSANPYQDDPSINQDINK